MNDKERKLLRYNTAKRIAIVTIAFSLILSILLILNHIQIKSVDPLNSTALNHLMLQLSDSPGDEMLKENIRAIDLLARKAYFTYLWQIRTGGFLLFGFVVAALIALKYMSSFRKNLPDLSEMPAEEGTWEDRLLARKAIIFSGVGFFALAIGLSLFTFDNLPVAVSPEFQTAGMTLSADYPDEEEVRRNWPNFRGPNGHGIAYVSSIPENWNGRTNENIRWKTAIPLPGFNSPIVWNNRVFLSGADKQAQAVYCIDGDTGQILWTAELDNIPGSPGEKPDNYEDTGLAASTMATDGILVYVIFGSGDVAAVDFEGRYVWGRNLGVPNNYYGHSSSLIVWRNLLLIQYDQTDGGRLVALQSDTGEIVYDISRAADISWASPILIENNGSPELILNSVPDVISHDPATGRVLWSVTCMSGEVGPSAAYADGMVYAVNAYARLAAISLQGTPEMIWYSQDDLPDVASPLATGEYVFIATSYGTISCFDAKTGERYWFEDLPRGFYSSPLLAGDKIYLLDLDGRMYIFRADRKFDLINTCELGESVVAVPAVVDGRIYIRGFNNLYCISE